MHQIGRGQVYCRTRFRHLTSAAQLESRHRQDGAVHVPLALARLDARVDAHGVVVALVPHELHAAIVQADGQHRAVGLGKALDAIIPLNADNLTGAFALNTSFKVRD